jgi:hypothetical protein
MSEGDSILAALAKTRDGDDDLGEAVVTKYAAVVEWMAPDGNRWLSLVTADAGDVELQRWDVQGMFFNVMHDPAWHPRDEDPDE